MFAMERRRGKSSFKDNGTIILELRECIPIQVLHVCDQSQHKTSYILRPIELPTSTRYSLLQIRYVNSLYNVLIQTPSYLMPI